jgi:hypothetical protein
MGPTSGADKFCSSARKDFFDSIDQVEKREAIRIWNLGVAVRSDLKCGGQPSHKRRFAMILVPFPGFAMPIWPAPLAMTSRIDQAFFPAHLSHEAC